MASSYLLRKHALCGGSLGLRLAESKEGFCSGSALDARWLHSPWNRLSGLRLLSRPQPRNRRAIGISMDGGASNAKRPAPAAAADGEADPDHLSRSSVAPRAAEFPAEEALEEQETDGIADELDYEEEVVIVKRPVRQRNSVSYQASVRQEVAPSPSGSGYPGSPLFWVGVGVALAVAGSWIAGRVKQRGQDAIMATLMKGLAGGAGNGGQPGFPMGGAGPNPFGTAPNPFNFPGMPPGMPPMPPPTAKPQPPSATVTDTTATPVQPAPKPKQPETKAAQSSAAAKEEKSTAKPKRASFSDVKEEELKQEEQKIKNEPKRGNIKEAEVISEGTSTSGGASFGSGSGTSGSNMTVDMLERMLDDPTIQQMVYPHLPEEMRNPETFKWMMQHPMYRQQMEEMLTNIGGNEQLIKGLDINSPEVKEQFEKMGMTPEQVVGKILSTPDVAQAFQNPRVQAAIMDVTANPMNIIKYQNDQEIMGIFDKISTLFPGMP